MKSGFKFLLLASFLFLSTSSMYAYDPAFTSELESYNLGIYTQTGERKIIVSTDHYGSIDVKCVSIFTVDSKKAFPIMNSNTGTVIAFVTSDAKFPVRKRQDLHEMVFDYASVDNFLDVEKIDNLSSKIKAQLSPTLSYFPESTKYTILPEAFQKGLHLKPKNELSWEEKQILNGSLDPQIDVEDFSNIDRIPTLTLSGFFFKVSVASEKNPEDFSIMSGTDFEKFCINLDIPFVRGSKVRRGEPITLGSVKLHVIPDSLTDNYDDTNWKRLGSVKELRENNFEVDYCSAKEYELFQQTGEDFNDGQVYVEYVSMPQFSYVTDYMIPVDVPGINVLLQEIGVKVNFRHDMANSDKQYELLFQKLRKKDTVSNDEVKTDDREFFEKYGFDRQNYEYLYIIE